MTLFNLLVPSFAKIYKHPRLQTADDIIPDLSGKVAIVTGGTGGLGLETSLQLAKKGAKVYVAGRSQKKGQAAIEKIRSVTGASEENVQFLELDLADIKKTKAAADVFLATSQPLHILVNNAGFIEMQFQLTPRDKLESHIAVEVGHFVFTKTLLSAIRKAGPGARIVNVSSDGHTMLKKPVNFEKLSSPEGEKEFPSSFERYAIEKVVGIQFAQALQRHLTDEPIYVNSCYPGLILSEFNRGITNTSGRILCFAMWVMEKLLYQSVEVGALTQLYLAASPEVESKGIKGQYLVPVAKVGTDSATSLARDQTEQKKYWDWAESVSNAALKRVD